MHHRHNLAKSKSYVMPINPEVIRFLPALEATYSVYSESMPAREILLCALNWPTDYWTALAVGWLEQGAPIDLEIAVRLEAIAQGRQYDQRTRHRSHALHKQWTKAKRT